MLNIEGSFGEGGGSIVRLAVALSAITNKPIKITNIRKGRDQPGLKEQHLQAIRAVSELCDGKLKGDKIGSTEIEFTPGEIKAKKLNVNIGTAGSVGLLLQCLLPVAFFSKNKVEIKIKGGGTFGTHSPNSLYLKNILLPTIEKMGFKADLEVEIINVPRPRRMVLISALEAYIRRDGFDTRLTPASAGEPSS